MAYRALGRTWPIGRRGGLPQAPGRVAGLLAASCGCGHSRWVAFPTQGVVCSHLLATRPSLRTITSSLSGRRPRRARSGGAARSKWMAAMAVRGRDVAAAFQRTLASLGCPLTAVARPEPQSQMAAFAPPGRYAAVVADIVYLSLCTVQIAPLRIARHRRARRRAPPFGTTRLLATADWRARHRGLPTVAAKTSP